MPYYLAQFAYTAEAWTALTKHPEEPDSGPCRGSPRSSAARSSRSTTPLAIGMASSFSRPPTRPTVTAFLLAAMSPGHLRATKTTVLMRPETMVEAMKKAGTATFQGPRK